MHQWMADRYIDNLQSFVFVLATHPGRIFSFDYSLNNIQEYASNDVSTVLYELRGNIS